MFIEMFIHNNPKLKQSCYYSGMVRPKDPEMTAAEKTKFVTYTSQEEEEAYFALQLCLCRRCIRSYSEEGPPAPGRIFRLSGCPQPPPGLGN